MHLEASTTRGKPLVNGSLEVIKVTWSHGSEIREAASHKKYDF
jgi:hypothetical protein